MDGARPHTNTKLKVCLADEFASRGWHLVNQPPNLPLTNVHDDYVFLSMSKSVLVAQGLTHGSHVLEKEHLWELVNKAWDNLPLDSLARAYVRHHQVVNAIHDCQGGDEFAAQQQGLHFNVCKLCVPYFAKEDDAQPAGVEVLEEEMDQMDSSKLQFKYHQPNVMGEPMGIVVWRRIGISV
jgi:hypothetical protein